MHQDIFPIGSNRRRKGGRIQIASGAVKSNSSLCFPITFHLSPIIARAVFTRLAPFVLLLGSLTIEEDCLVETSLLIVGSYQNPGYESELRK